MDDSTTTLPAAEPGLKRKTLSGAAWISGGQVAQIIIRFGVVVILTRLLAPADFGLVALAVTIIGLCQIVAPLGTAAALVQLRDAGPLEIRAAFTISMVMATILAPASVGLGYAMERTSQIPNLALATFLLSPAIYLDAVSKIASRMLQTNMRFKPAAVAPLLGHLAGYGGIGVALALKGFGWRALCCAEVASVALSASYLVWVGRPQFGLTFDTSTWQRLVGFGARLTAANLLDWGASNLPRMLIGALAGATALGLYSRAADLSARFGSLVDRLSGTVMFAAFCQRSNDMSKLARVLCASTSLVLVVTLPASAMLSALGDPLLLVLFGNQWTGAVGTFRILAFLIPLLLLQRIALTMGHSLGRPDFAVTVNALALLIALVGSAIGIRYGLEGMALAVLIAVGVSSVLALLMVSREVGLPLSHLGASATKGSLLALGVFTLSVVSPSILANLLKPPVGALPQVAIVVPFICGILMVTWSVGQRWLFSPPARALILDARLKLGGRLASAAATEKQSPGDVKRD